MKKTKEISKINSPNYEENVTFFPVTRLDNQNKFYGHSLEKGKYDINYVINILKIIVEKCEQLKMRPQDLAFTLTESCKRLIAMLEVEKMQN